MENNQLNQESDEEISSLFLEEPDLQKTAIEVKQKLKQCKFMTSKHQIKSGITQINAHFESAVSTICKLKQEVIKEFKKCLQLKNYKQQMEEVNHVYKLIKRQFQDVIDQAQMGLHQNYQDQIVKSELESSEGQDLHFMKKELNMKLGECNLNLGLLLNDRNLKENVKIKLLSNQLATQRELSQVIKNSIRLQFPIEINKFDLDSLNFSSIDKSVQTPQKNMMSSNLLSNLSNIGFQSTQATQAFGTNRNLSLLSAKRNSKLMDKIGSQLSKTSVLQEIESRISDQILSTINSQDKTFDLNQISQQFQSKSYIRTIMDQNKNKYHGEMQAVPGTSGDLIKHGQGELIYCDGSSYEGSWHQDKRHGQGVQITTAKDRYEGFWYDDQKSGKGKMTYYDGRVYEGEWKFDCQHGFGTMKDPDGYYYEGEWHMGLPHGQGFACFKDGSRYTGSFLQGERNGYGVNTLKDGSEYEGLWMKEQMHGQGVYKYFDGRVFIGKFENGKKNGRGELTKLNGTIVEGDWNNDALVKIIKESKH
eukprot:403373833